MPELDLTHPDHRGLNIEPIALYQDIYYLAAIFGASRYISETYKRTDGEVVQYDNFWIFRNIEISEIYRRLISIAVICRSYYDHTSEEARDLAMVEEDIVGVFVNKEATPLTFRESCNKIIHSTWTNFDLTDNRDLFSGYINPILYIYGFKDNREWKVKLDIDKFIKRAFDIIP